MNISEALTTFTTYPIPSTQVEKACIDRGLVSTDEYTKSISESEEYELATADLYLWMHSAPNLKEQEISFSFSSDERDSFLEIANSIYGKYDDDKFTGRTFGFIGEDFNG